MCTSLSVYQQVSRLKFRLLEGVGNKRIKLGLNLVSLFRIRIYMNKLWSGSQVMPNLTLFTQIQIFMQAKQDNDMETLEFSH